MAAKLNASVDDEGVKVLATLESGFTVLLTMPAEALQALDDSDTELDRFLEGSSGYFGQAVEALLDKIEEERS